MATPTLQEVKARAKALTDDPQLQGYIDTATTVEAVESMLANSGFSSFEVNTITRDEIEIQRAEDDALKSLKDEVLDSIEDTDLRKKVEDANSMTEVKEATDAVEGEGESGSWLDRLNKTVDTALSDWFSGRTLDRLFGTSPSGRPQYPGDASE